MLLNGYHNGEMAKELGLAPRTIKAMMNRLFLKYGLGDATGIKRVKLAVLLYRERNSQPASTLGEGRAARAGGVG